ncbi:hypothetical protein DPMN_047802 [Dreissena polymorpha]|uniref:Uncharacterized protein n=1 Tax=Dreissena polymorpha TaxID=45954 RepID=A0A9D4I1R4_DREPO|nr:hypothetical protein DPMN_047802 [Dreissena polymorpha]
MYLAAIEKLTANQFLVTENPSCDVTQKPPIVFKMGMSDTLQLFAIFTFLLLLLLLIIIINNNSNTNLTSSSNNNKHR